jgi:hypothetical protein
MADSVSDDRAELFAASDLEAWCGNSGSMAARGVAEMTSRISSEEEEDDASLWREKVTGGEEILRWLTGDDGGLAEVPRRENVRGMNEVRMAGGERPGYI